MQSQPQVQVPGVMQKLIFISSGTVSQLRRRYLKYIGGSAVAKGITCRNAGKQVTRPHDWENSEIRCKERSAVNVMCMFRN